MLTLLTLPLRAALWGLLALVAYAWRCHKARAAKAKQARSAWQRTAPAARAPHPYAPVVRYNWAQAGRLVAQVAPVVPAELAAPRPLAEAITGRWQREVEPVSLTRVRSEQGTQVWEASNGVRVRVHIGTGVMGARPVGARVYATVGVLAREQGEQEQAYAARLLMGAVRGAGLTVAEH